MGHQMVVGCRRVVSPRRVSKPPQSVSSGSGPFEAARKECKLAGLKLNLGR